jgi:hypothetical protein
MKKHFFTLALITIGILVADFSHFLFARRRRRKESNKISGNMLR